MKRISHKYFNKFNQEPGGFLTCVILRFRAWQFSVDSNPISTAVILLVALWNGGQTDLWIRREAAISSRGWFEAALVQEQHHKHSPARSLRDWPSPNWAGSALQGWLHLSTSGGLTLVWLLTCSSGSFSASSREQLLQAPRSTRGSSSQITSSWDNQALQPQQTPALLQSKKTDVIIRSWM